MTQHCRVSVTDSEFGAVGDWDGTDGTDDAPAFQAAIDFVAANGGGEVYVPQAAKAYRWHTHLHVKPGVRLVGSVTMPMPNFYVADLTNFYGGHCIAITWGAGSVGEYGTGTGSALRLSPGGSVSGLKFIHPGQVSHPALPPIAFPPVISGFEYDCPGGVIENLYFVNAYRAIYLPGAHGELRIKSVWGQVIDRFITLGGVYNADQISDVNASGIFYFRQHPDNGFGAALNEGFWSWVQNNGIAFDIGYADAIRFTDCFVGNCYIAYRFGGIAQVPSMGETKQLAYGDVIGGGIEGVTFPILVVGGSDGSSGGINSNGMRFTSVGIAAVGLYSANRSVCILMGQPNVNPPETAVGGDAYRGKLIFNSCVFWGTGSWAENVGPLEGVIDAVGGDIEFSCCTFKIQQSYVARAQTSSSPIFKFSACTFNDEPSLAPSYYHFAAEAGSKARFFFDDLCEFRKPLMTTSASPNAYIQGRSNITVASSATVTIPRYGEFVSVSGAAPMASVIPIRPSGSRITLRFVNGVVVYADGNIKLTANLARPGGSTLSLISDGSNWWPVGSLG